MKPDVRRPLQYAAGAGFVHHATGKRLSRDAVESALTYHRNVAALKHAMPERRENSLELIAQIERAVALTWPEKKDAAE